MGSPVWLRKLWGCVFQGAQVIESGLGELAGCQCRLTLDIMLFPVLLQMGKLR